MEKRNSGPSRQGVSWKFRYHCVYVQFSRMNQEYQGEKVINSSRCPHHSNGWFRGYDMKVEQLKVLIEGRLFALGQKKASPYNLNLSGIVIVPRMISSRDGMGPNLYVPNRTKQHTIYYISGSMDSPVTSGDKVGCI